jgi:hypothetical protein
MDMLQSHADDIPKANALSDNFEIKLLPTPPGPGFSQEEWKQQGVSTQTPDIMAQSELSSKSKYYHKTQTHLVELHDKQKKIQTLLRKRTSIVPALAQLEERIHEAEAALALFRAAMHLKDYEVTASESYICEATQKAMQVTQRSSRDPLIARCKYWLGRIEWLRGNETQAYGYFHRAQQYIKDIPEGVHVPLYLKFLEPGPKAQKEDRQRNMLKTSCVTLPPHSKQMPTRQHQSFANGPQQPVKRKLEAIYNSAVHMATNLKPDERDRDSKIWLKSDDIRRSGFLRTLPTRRKQQDRDMAWLAAAKSSRYHPPQCKFEFTLYPRGLAPRTRPTNIFPEHIYEYICPAERWKSLRETIKNMVVTWALLAYERRKMDLKIIQRRDRILKL